MNLDEYSDNIGTHWVAMHVNNNVTYFDSFGVEHIPEEIKAFINNKNIKTNIFGIQAYGDCNCTRTQNHLFCKGTLNHLVKLAE